MTKTTPPGITFFSGTYHARIKRNGVWHTRPGRHDLKDALKDLEELEKLHGQRRHGRPPLTDADRKRRLAEQMATLPPWETMRNIHPTKSGFTVMLRRRTGVAIYGGHHAKLLDAIARRDELELQHTKK